MKLKLVLLIAVFTGLLQANECNINYTGTLGKDNIMSYTVNDESLVVTLDRGMVYRIFAYVDGYKKETYKEAFVFSDKICFGSGNKECVAVPSFENDVLVKTFLKNSFCKE